MSEHADQFEERDDGEEELADDQQGKGYGEDGGSATPLSKSPNSPPALHETST